MEPRAARSGPRAVLNVISMIDKSPCRGKAKMLFGLKSTARGREAWQASCKTQALQGILLEPPPLGLHSPFSHMQLTGKAAQVQAKVAELH